MTEFTLYERFKEQCLKEGGTEELALEIKAMVEAGRVRVFQKENGEFIVRFLERRNTYAL